MTTSGTTSFNLELDELFDEAYGRVGIGKKNCVCRTCNDWFYITFTHLNSLVFKEPRRAP